MTDFISRDFLHKFAKVMNKEHPDKSINGARLHYMANTMPDPKPVKTKTHWGCDCCGRCESIDGVFNIMGGHNKFCGNCGWPIDWGD